MWSRILLLSLSLFTLSTAQAQFLSQLKPVPPPEGFVTDQQSLSLLENWIQASDGTWHSARDLCVMGQDRSSKDYAPLTTLEDAHKAALGVQKNLEKQELTDVQLEIVPRPDQFALFVHFDYVAQGRPHRARQLYLSDGGKLKTLTGSSELPQDDACVFEMERFLKLKGY